MRVQLSLRTIPKPISWSPIRGHRPFILLALGFFALTFAYGFRLPLWEAPDEARHVAVARDVAAGRIPLYLGGPGVVRYLAGGQQGVIGQEGQPPLYYLIAAPLVGLADGTWAPQLPLPFPRGAVAAVHALRLLSTLMALVTIAFVYWTVWLLFMHRGFAIAVACLTALTPGFALTSASANNDNAAIMFSSLSTLMLVRTLTAPQSQPYALVLAALASLAAMLAKLTAVIIVPMFAVTLAIELVRRGGLRFRLQAILAGGVLGGAVAVACTISPYSASAARFRQFLGDARSPLSLASLSQVMDSVLLGDLPAVGQVLFTTYWGFAGWQTRAPLDFNVAMALVFLTIVAWFGAIRYMLSAAGVRLLSGGRKPALGVLCLGLCLALVLLIIVQLGRPKITEPKLAYARYLFPAITAASLFMMGGPVALSPRRWRAPVVLVVLAGFAALHVNPTFAGPAHYTGPLALDARRSPQAAKADPLAQFVNGTSVVEYGLSARRLIPGDVLRLTLLWRADGDRREDFAAFAHLVGADGAALVKSDAVPTAHRFPPRLWRTGDLVLDYRELLIPAEPRPGVYSVQVGSYTESRGKLFPVAVNTPLRPRETTRFDLAQVIVRPAPAAPSAAARPVGAVFSEGILLGHALIEEPWVAGRPLAVALYWAARGTAQRDYSVSVQLLGPDRAVVAQRDGPLGGFYRTSLWEAGDALAERYVLSPAGPLPAGRYTLGVAVYDPASGRRLPALLDGTPAADSFVRLSTFAAQ